MNIKEVIVKGFNKVVFETKKHSPEIFMGVGCVGMVGAAVLACHATTKIGTVKEQLKKDLDDIKEGRQLDEDGSLPDGTTYSEEDAKKDTAIVVFHAGVEYAKLYAPAVILGALSLASIVTSHRIMAKRNAALTAAYTTVAGMFAKYRDNVKERFGAQVDKELRYGYKAEKVKKTVVDEKTGEVTEKEETVESYGIDEYSDYARVFDEGNSNWKNNDDYNLMFLGQVQNWANMRLKQRGYLFLNEVYDALGMRGSAEGQIVGWTDHGEDQYVSLGIDDIIAKMKIRDPFDDMSSRHHRAESYILDFNVDGPIYTNCDYTAKGANV